MGVSILGLLILSDVEARQKPKPSKRTGRK